MITPNPAPTTGFTRLSCAVETTLNIIDGRWKVLILRELFAGTMRFAQLRRALQGVTQKMLTQQLRELEADGIVHRQVYPEVPPRVGIPSRPWVNPCGQSWKRCTTGDCTIKPPKVSLIILLMGSQRCHAYRSTMTLKTMALKTWTITKI